MDREHWHSDDDEAVLADYLAEHAYGSSLDGDTLVIGVGDPDRVPPLPEFCAICDTPLGQVDGAYVHLRGFRERGGCQAPFPR